MTVAIVFNSGSYGTYLEWCLATLTSKDPIQSPFTTEGNSHCYRGVHLLDINGWKNYVNKQVHHQFVRFHPKTKKSESLSDNLNYVCNTATSVVYLYPDLDSVLLCINNYITKMWADWWEKQFNRDIDINCIYQNWPVAPGSTADQIPKWVQREFLSFYLMPAWFDQIEWYHPNSWSNPKACIIRVKELLFDFENTIKNISQHCNIDLVRSVIDLLPYHQQNLDLQKHLTQDQLCKNIINQTLTGQDFHWGALPLGSEVWIQWQLRNLGFEIQCHGLDMFPTNSVHLKELLYSV
jgi:hypothetical protein